MRPGSSLLMSAVRWLTRYGDLMLMIGSATSRAPNRPIGARGAKHADRNSGTPQ